MQVKIVRFNFEYIGFFKYQQTRKKLELRSLLDLHWKRNKNANEEEKNTLNTCYHDVGTANLGSKATLKEAENGHKAVLEIESFPGEKIQVYRRGGTTFFGSSPKLTALQEEKYYFSKKFLNLPFYLRTFP